MDVLNQVRSGAPYSIFRSPYGVGHFCIIDFGLTAKREVPGKYWAICELAVIAAAGLAIVKFGAVGEDGHIPERGVGAFIPNRHPIGLAAGGANGGAVVFKAPSCRVCRLVYSATGRRSR